jgi:hypothetical protein
MLWFYSRNRQKLTLEVRYDNDTHEFVAIVTGLAGPQITKRFATSEEFREWVADLDTKLAAEQWKSDGAPHILPDGWRDAPWKL